MKERVELSEEQVKRIARLMHQIKIKKKIIENFERSVKDKEEELEKLHNTILEGDTYNYACQRHLINIDETTYELTCSAGSREYIDLTLVKVIR